MSGSEINRSVLVINPFGCIYDLLASDSLVILGSYMFWLHNVVIQIVCPYIVLPIETSYHLSSSVSRIPTSEYVDF